MNADIILQCVFVVVVFIVLFVVILNTLKRTALFRGSATWIISVCISLLCLISLFDTLAVPAKATSALSRQANHTILAEEKQNNESDHQLRQMILLPYLALFLSILAVLILCLLKKILTFVGFSGWSLDKRIKKSTTRKNLSDLTPTRLKPQNKIMKMISNDNG